MRELGRISGFAILLFLITAVKYYEGNHFTQICIASGMVIVVICMIVIEISSFGAKQKTKGYILRG